MAGKAAMGALTRPRQAPVSARTPLSSSTGGKTEQRDPGEARLAARRGPTAALPSSWRGLLLASAIACPHLYNCSVKEVVRADSAYFATSETPFRLKAGIVARRYLDVFRRSDGHYNGNFATSFGDLN
ncbi:hypothetical protein ACTMU2_21645 [Cupriavidus basilensis]